MVGDQVWDRHVKTLKSKLSAANLLSFTILFNSIYVVFTDQNSLLLKQNRGLMLKHKYHYGVQFKFNEEKTQKKSESFPARYHAHKGDIKREGERGREMEQSIR